MPRKLLPGLLTACLTLPCLGADAELDRALERCKEQERRIQQLESYIRSIDGKIPPRPLPSTPVTELTPKPTPVLPLNPNATVPTNDSSTYVVKSGDNWDNIARKLNCSPDTLSHLNGLTVTSIIFPGQKLKIPTSSSTPPPPTPTPSSARTYTIQDGDTYSSISKKFKIPVNTLIAANPKIKPTALRTGLVIKLGKETSTPPAEPTPTPPQPTANTRPKPIAPTPPPTDNHPHPTPTSTVTTTHPTPTVSQANPSSTPVSTTPSEKGQTITLSETMTFGQLAQQHGTTIAELNQINDQELSENTILAKGTKIVVPHSKNSQ